LGLSNVLEYRERMGTFGTDPFNGNENNVLQVFYELVTPGRMASWLSEKIQTRKDLELREKLGELEKRRDASASVGTGQSFEGAYLTKKEKVAKDLDQAKKDNDEEWVKSLEDRAVILEKNASRWKELNAKRGDESIANDIRQLDMFFGIKQTKGPTLTEKEREELNSQIVLTKGKWRESRLFRPISCQMAIEYLTDQKIVDPSSDMDWWKPYFTEDPMVEEKAAITPEGVSKLLVHLGYVI
jgi:hypothetical protein